MDCRPPERPLSPLKSAGPPKGVFSKSVAPRPPLVITHHPSLCPTFLATLSSDSADRVTQGLHRPGTLPGCHRIRGSRQQRSRAGDFRDTLSSPGVGEVEAGARAGSPPVRPPLPVPYHPSLPLPAPPRLTQALRMLEQSSTSATNLEKTYDSESFAFKVNRLSPVPPTCKQNGEGPQKERPPSSIRRGRPLRDRRVGLQAVPPFSVTIRASCDFFRAALLGWMRRRVPNRSRSADACLNAAVADSPSSAFITFLMAVLRRDRWWRFRSVRRRFWRFRFSALLLFAKTQISRLVRSNPEL
jgi:hypothetical protein